MKVGLFLEPVGVPQGQTLAIRIPGAREIQPVVRHLPAQLDIRIFGSEGMLLLDIERARLAIHRHDKQNHIFDVASDAGGYNCEGPPNNFVDLILGNTSDNYTPGEVAMRSVMILDAAYRSAKSGQMEKV